MATAITFVGLGGFLALLAAGLAGVPRMYRKRPYLEPAAHEPGVIWFPKYRLPLAAVPPESEVKTRMAALGFIRSDAGEDGGGLHFTRGSPWGDFSIRRARMDVTVQGQPGGSGELFVEAGWFILFDTGDTWQLTRKIAESLQAA